MTRRKIHIVYEYGIDLRPHASSYIRLIRPLTHPILSENLEVTYSTGVTDQPVEAVIVDRLWRPDITPALADRLVMEVHHKKAHLIYALDDNLLDLPQIRSDWPLAHHLEALAKFMEQADQIRVPTAALKERLANFNGKIAVIPNALDERLLPIGRWHAGVSLFGERPKVIGFMGTLTHDEDLIMVAPALQELWKRHPKEFIVEIVGVAGNPASLEALAGMPVRLITPPPEEQEYPLFLLWLSSHVDWDIAIAPLVDNPFTRCKSDIKFLDYCAIGAAGIYSNVPAYSSSVRHLDTGWLVENQVDAWVDALEEMLSNSELRVKISENASVYLQTERLLMEKAHLWLKALPSRTI